ncbi:MAG: urea amidolyase family protein [Acidimicrobiales bacterium]
MNIDIVPFGDSALLVEVGDVGAAHRLAFALESAREGAGLPDAVDEWVVGFGNVVVHLTPDHEPPEVVERWLGELSGSVDRTVGSVPPLDRRKGPPLVIPASFDGPDLDEVATLVGMTPAAVVEQLTDTVLNVAFIGFSPGFPYLVGLPPELMSVPRRPTPRPSVPAGSVAVAGEFASVYPQSTPGGWMLLGRTTVSLFDPLRPPYALLRPGDAVRFAAEPSDSTSRSRPGAASRPDADTGADGHGAVQAGDRAPLDSRGDRFAVVVAPGLLSLVEDGGRRGRAGLGVPRAGPADPETMGLANRLVGNPAGAAAIELTASGPTLCFHVDAHVAVLAGAADDVGVGVDGHPVGADTVVPVRAGQTMSVGAVRSGLRAYLAVAGSFDTPVVVGSRASDLLCGLGPGPLRAGDRLGLGPPSRPRGRLDVRRTRSLPGGPHRVRVLPGPHRFSAGQVELLLSQPWEVGGASNRIGLRLFPAGGTAVGDRSVPPGPVLTSRTVPSTGMVTGAIQVPPDGQPIVLMPDHATVGGYPVIACVIGVDLSVLGRLRPGDVVTFSDVERREALEERFRQDRNLAAGVSGWFPTATGT